MFQRGAGPTQTPGCAPETEFQNDVEDMFAENVISGARATQLLAKARNAGVKIATRFLKKQAGGKKKRWYKNAARDMKRRIRKNDHWPDPYWFYARVWDRKKQEEVIQLICILLPSEVLECLWKYGLKEVLLCKDNYDKLTKDHHQWMQQQLNVEDLLGFGFHGDGVPCNYDRTTSVMLTSINLPGLTGRNGRLRIPLIILPDHVISDQTFDDVYEVLAWDMRSLLSGVRHECRHDRSPWHPFRDKKRSKGHGQRDFRACLVQVRSDWDWLTKCYHFPGHASKDEFCWMCRCQRKKVWGVDGYFVKSAS